MTTATLILTGGWVGAAPSGGGGGGGTGATADEVAAAVWAYTSGNGRTLTAFGQSTLTEFTYTVTNSVDSQPLAGVTVRISTDSVGVNTAWVGTTDAFGVARDAYGQKARLAAGTYYFWRNLSGYSFNDPDQESVS